MYKLPENHLNYWCSYQFSKSLSLILLWKFHLLNTLTSDCCLFYWSIQNITETSLLFSSQHVPNIEQSKTKQKSVAKTIAVDLKEAYEWVKAEEEAEKYCIAQVFSFGEINEYYVFFKQYTLHCNFYC